MLLTGNGDVIEPDDGLLAVGSGGNYALAAARALMRHAPELSARELALGAIGVAAELCVFTNDEFIVEQLSGDSPKLAGEESPRRPSGGE